MTLNNPGLNQNEADWNAIVHWGQFQGGFLARTAHELRSPLSCLMSLQQLILNDLCDNPAEERQYIQDAYEAATRLLKMLEIVTQVSKIEAGLSPLQLERIDPQILLEEVHHFSQLQAKNRNVQLHIDTHHLSQSNCNLWGDYRVLRQVLLCLIESSLWTIAQGSVHLWCEPDSTTDYLNINLRDDRSAEQWQDVKSFFISPGEEKNSTIREFNLQQGNCSINREKNPPQIPYFSVEYSLYLSQLLLTRMQGKLKLIENIHQPVNSANLPTFYFQCQIPRIPMADPQVDCPSANC